MNKRGEGAVSGRVQRIGGGRKMKKVKQKAGLRVPRLFGLYSLYKKTQACCL